VSEQPPQGPPPSGDYPGGYYPLPYQPPLAVYLPPYSAFAVLALIFSLLWLCGIGSVVGLVCGAFGIRECKREGKRGMGMAITGVVLGGMGTILFVWVLAAIGWEAATA